MKISNININGIADFLGYDTQNGLMCSWLVSDTASKRQAMAEITLSGDPEFSRVLYSRRGEDLCSRGEALDFKPSPRTTYYLRIRVTGDAGDTAEGLARFETGKMDEPWAADWIGPREGDDCHPVLAREFPAENAVSRARLYICGLGLYEAYLNGQKVGDEYLTPNLSDYSKEFQVQAYDVTALLREQNTLEIHLGNGWYKGRFGLDGSEENWGKRFAALAELRIEYADGTGALIKTDGSWRYTASEICHSGIYDGEHVDRLCHDGAAAQLPVDLVPLDKAKLCDRFSLPVKIMHELPVAEVIHTPAGETVLDMGQNFAGFIRFWCDQPKGARITLDFGEVLQNGCFYNANYRSADARFVYISDGKAGLIRPKFTFYGFRYVRVSGWQGALDPQAFCGCVLYSAMRETGCIESSNEKLNRLFLNCVWGQRSNFLDMPTDCPQRDERLGWTGDAQVFAPTACYNMDTRVFYDKFLRGLRHEQNNLDGGIPAYIPKLGPHTMISSVWGDAATFIPATLYEHYGDLRALRRYYPMMRDWLDYVRRQDTAGRHLFDTGQHFGDWLALDGVTPSSMKGGTDDTFIASCYYFRSAQLVAEAAASLGYADDAREYTSLSGQIRQAIIDEYFTATGRLAIDTQTAYILALRFGLYTNKEKLQGQLNARLKKDCYRLTGGFVGAPLLCDTLGQHGMDELAVHFLLNEEFPGWLYSVNLGATTIWERWNSLLPDGRVNPEGMNSFNHYAYGSVIQYLYAGLAGIQCMAPGFSRVRFAPAVTGRLGRLSACYRSVSGDWVSAWRIEADGRVSIHVEVPFGCTAVLAPPRYSGAAIELAAGPYDLCYSPTEDFRRLFSGRSRLDELKSCPRAMDILARELPEAHARVLAGDREFAANTLDELRHMFYLGIQPAAADRAAAALCELIYEEAAS